MTSFAQRCGIHTPEREAAVQRVLRLIEASGVEMVRFSWCDQHGMLRGKTLVASAVEQALRGGVGMVGTLLLKDTSDRTAFPVFEPAAMAELPGFAGASNLMLMADPASYRPLPWASKTGWLQCQSWFQDGSPVLLDTRRVLQTALARLAQAGFGMVCGLEVELHIYKLRQGDGVGVGAVQLDPAQASWPGPPPEVDLIHPGFNLLSEAWADRADEPLRILQHTAQALGLPLTSLEIELGPSQVEAVFAATDALTAADNMVLFRSAAKQALLRAGYHATFMCRPPFEQIMSSGWHLHQSLVQLNSGANAFLRDIPAPGTTERDALHTLSATGEHYLAGLLAHAQGSCVFAAPSINAYARFRPKAMAPQAVLWGKDNRGAMLRVVGHAGDSATRIENRIGEPMANPYLYIASQIHAGLDGIQRELKAPIATDSPYGSDAPLLPTSLQEALDALRDDAVLTDAFGSGFVNYLCGIKQAEIDRHVQAEDSMEWQRREYFARF